MFDRSRQESIRRFLLNPRVGDHDSSATKEALISPGNMGLLQLGSVQSRRNSMAPGLANPSTGCGAGCGTGCGAGPGHAIYHGPDRVVSVQKGHVHEGVNCEGS